MTFARLLSTRCASVHRASLLSLKVRSFSQCTEKLKVIIDTYRSENYSMETERAFQNEIMKVLDRNQSHQIRANDVRDFIKNIGATDKIALDEIEFALSEIGGGSDTASSDKMRSFLSS